MREKAENEARDRYARRYAAVLAVEAMIQFRAKTAHIVTTVEAEDKAEWDDIVQVVQPKNVSHRHQVKRQQTPLSADDFGKYVKAAAAGDALVEYHFAFPTMIDVKDVENTRILRTMCGRLRQEGANHAKVLEGLREGEKKWLEAVKKWAGVDDAGAMKLLTRIHLDAIGFEEDLDNRALRLLEPVFGAATEEAWKRVKAFVADKDGVVEIEPEALFKTLPPPAADEIETFYWSFVEEVETKFELNAWTWLTDNVVRNIIPEEFEDNVYDYSLSVQRAVWPDRYPELKAAFKDLARHAVEYMNHFRTRAKQAGKWIREDKWWERHFDKPWYAEQEAAANKWDRGNVPRLANMVVALNRLFDAVRKHLRKTYRLRDGQLGVHDPMGTRNDGEGAIYYWHDFLEIKEGE